MSKLKLHTEYAKGVREDVDARKSVTTQTAPRIRFPAWVKTAGSALVSGGIGVFCAWAALYFLGRW